MNSKVTSASPAPPQYENLGTVDDRPGGIYIEVGEIRIDIAYHVVARDLRLDAMRQELLVHRSPADDPGNVLIRDGSERFLNRMNNFDAPAFKRGITREHNVATVLERTPAGKALKGLTSHDDGMALGLIDKMAHIGTISHHHIAIPSNPPVIAHSDDGLKLTCHHATLFLYIRGTIHF